MLNWPIEGAFSASQYPGWDSSGSNIALDFHGDPARAKVVVLSDGNHHMALEEALGQFSSRNPDAGPIFYATTPPTPIVALLKKGGLRLGNLILSVKPHIFISPPNILEGLVTEGILSGYEPFFRNQGNVLLIKRDNPRQIKGLADLQREDVVLFLSNPETEGASYSAYIETLQSLGRKQGLDFGFLADTATSRVRFGKNIHHREAPQAIADDSADVAVVYYHLALRYVRIFPEIFDYIPLGGTPEKPLPAPGNVISRTAIGLIDRDDPFAGRLFDFLRSRMTADIYGRHGLIHHLETPDSGGDRAS